MTVNKNTEVAPVEKAKSASIVAYFADMYGKLLERLEYRVRCYPPGSNKPEVLTRGKTDKDGGIARLNLNDRIGHHIVLEVRQLAAPGEEAWESVWSMTKLEPRNHMATFIAPKIEITDQLKTSPDDNAQNKASVVKATSPKPPVQGVITYPGVEGMLTILKSIIKYRGKAEGLPDAELTLTALKKWRIDYPKEQFVNPDVSWLIAGNKVRQGTLAIGKLTKQENVYIGMCLHYVKIALWGSGLVTKSKSMEQRYARDAGEALKDNGFTNIADKCKSPYDAPHGAVIVYSEYKNGVERPGHIEVYDKHAPAISPITGKPTGETGMFYSDFATPNAYVRDGSKAKETAMELSRENKNAKGVVIGKTIRKVIGIWVNS